MFVVEELAVIKGPIRFFKLKISQHCPLDEFWRCIEQEGNLAKQLNSALALMERFSKSMPTPKVKNISRKGDRISFYEVKTNDLRIYFFRDPNGAIVVTGGRKSTQEQDITRFRNIAHEYINNRPL